ncbi:Pentapeptide repeats (8 copies) [compost metagenome]
MLTGARFNEVIAPLDALNEEDAVYFGIYPVSFINTDLTHASFQDAIIAADFRGAKLEDVNFQGADLTGSLMLRKDEMDVKLTPAQRLAVKWS